jgi:hypothetical protein
MFHLLPVNEALEIPSIDWPYEVAISPKPDWDHYKADLLAKARARKEAQIVNDKSGNVPGVGDNGDDAGVGYNKVEIERMNKNSTFASRSCVLTIACALAMALLIVACTKLIMRNMNIGGSLVRQALTCPRLLFPLTKHQKDPRALSSTILSLSSEEMAAYEEETKVHNERALQSACLSHRRKVP